MLNTADEKSYYFFIIFENTLLGIGCQMLDIWP